MSTRVEIVEQQLPEQLRPLLVDYHQAQRRALDAHQALTRAGVPDKPALAGPAEDTARDAAEAHRLLLEATREQPMQMRQHAHAQYMAAVERAREHLQAAEAELRVAAGHAAVHGSVRDGRPTVNFERGLDAKGRQAALFVVGVVQEAVSHLPDSIDG